MFGLVDLTHQDVEVETGVLFLFTINSHFSGDSAGNGVIGFHNFGVDRDDISRNSELKLILHFLVQTDGFRDFLFLVLV